MPFEAKDPLLINLSVFLSMSRNLSKLLWVAMFPVRGVTSLGLACRISWDTCSLDVATNKNQTNPVTG